MRAHRIAHDDHPVLDGASARGRPLRRAPMSIRARPGRSRRSMPRRPHHGDRSLHGR